MPLKSGNRKDVRMIIAISDTHRAYMDIIHKKEEVNYTHIMRQMISYYIKHNPIATLVGVANEKSIKKIVDNKADQESSLEQIVEDAGTLDISQICDYANCPNKDIRYFNQLIETTADDGEAIIELELRSLCPTHYLHFTNEQGWKLELLD